MVIDRTPGTALAVLWRVKVGCPELDAEEGWLVLVPTSQGTIRTHFLALVTIEAN